VGKCTCRTVAADGSGSMDGLRGKRAPGIVIDGRRRRARGSGSGAGSSSSSSCSSCGASASLSLSLCPSTETRSSAGSACERGWGGVL